MVDQKIKLWGGAFSKSPAETAWKFGQSTVSDLNMLDEEIDVSVAHAKMLGTVGVVSPEEADQLVSALLTAKSAVLEQPLLVDQAEDLPGAIEWLLHQALGDTAHKLHAGRSRNDQVVTVTKLWMKRRCNHIQSELSNLLGTLLELAEKHLSDPMPGYTHQQPAQPVTLGFQFLAYFWMLKRDFDRFSQVISNADSCPLGAAALAGTSLPIDRELTASLLGFSNLVPNACDAVSDRDFIGDALHALSTLMQHLSRISQEIVLFSTFEFGYLRLDDAYSTGSSIMPQKRNPDFAELIRGRSARVIGHWTAFMCMMKALPLGYNRDQQEDKPPLFDSVALALDSLVLTREMLATATYQLENMADCAGKGQSTVTSVAEALVKTGVPFRTAHERVGKWAKSGLHGDPELDSIPMTVKDSIDGRESIGGTGKVALQNQLNLAKATYQTEISQ
ncbi:MAG: argininosuccinate lyase [Fimbriimonadaceae bacterium]